MYNLKFFAFFSPLSGWSNDENWLNNVWFFIKCCRPQADSLSPCFILFVVQVLESVFQQDRGQGASLENLSKNVLVGKGQVTAMAALKELRKISNLLSEM